MHPRLRMSIGFVSVAAAMAGALLSLTYLAFSGLLVLGTSTNALTAEGMDSRREAVAQASVALQVFAAGAAVATGLAFATAWVGIWIHCRHRSEAASVSPSAVAFAMIAAFYTTAWLIVVPPKPAWVFHLLFAYSGLLVVLIPLCGAFCGALVGTFLRKRSVLYPVWAVFFAVMLVASYYLGLRVTGIAK